MSRRGGWLSVILGVSLAWAAWPAPQAAAWDVRVGTRTRLTAAVRAQGTLVSVEGFLRDNVGQGVPGMGVSLDFTRQGEGGAVVRRDAVTDRAGRFALTTTLPAGTWQGRVAFSGQQYYFETAEVDLGPVRTARGEVQLSALTPPVALRSRGSAVVTLGALSAPAGAQAAEPVSGLKLLFQAGSAPPVEVQTGSAGTVPVSVDLGEVEDATLPLTVRLADTQHFREARASASLRVLGAPSLTLEAAAVRARLERGLRAAGALEDRHGGGPGLPVEVAVYQGQDERARLRATTDADGAWEVFIPEAQLPEGALRVEAAALLGPQDRLEAAPVVLAFQRTGLGWTPWALGGALALALLGAGGLAARDALRRRQAEEAAKPRRVTPQQARTPGIAAAPAGSRPARAASAGRDSLAGQLWDDHAQLPIPGAQVTLRRADPAAPVLQVTSDEDGAFAFDAPGEGAWRLEAAARGYVTASHAVALPHRGDLSWFRFALTPVRVVVRDLYAALVEDLARDHARWGRLTPRQVYGLLLAAVAELRAQQSVAAPAEGWTAFEASLQRLRADAAEDAPPLDGPALVEALTHLVEEVYFSQRAYDEDIIAVTERLTATLRDAALKRRREVL